MGPGNAQAVEVQNQPHVAGLSPGRQCTVLNLGVLILKSEPLNTLWVFGEEQ